jgi:hypothetical protein
MWLVGGLCGVVLLAFVAGFHAELSRIGGNMANSMFGDMFGARSLAFGVPALFGMPAAGDPGAALLGWALFGLMSAGCMLTALLRGQDPVLHNMLEGVGATERSLLLVGGVLCTGCFFGHQNIGYRAVLLLLVLPGLLALVRVAAERRERLVYRSTSLLVVLVLWDGIVSRSRPGWFVMHVAWWWIVFVLLTIVVSLLGGELVRLAGPCRRLLAGPDAAQ